MGVQSGFHLLSPAIPQTASGDCNGLFFVTPVEIADYLIGIGK
jgi:hypothetical protein